MQKQWRRILEHLVRPEEPDAVLLRRFIEQQDAEAFAELVRRYDGLVWSQCRHLLPCEADADDAFQATFFALIRSAKKIRRNEHLGPWLHGVAYRVCLNARRASAKRARHEQAAVAVEAGQPVADTAWDETLAAVHEEVNRLPESLRVAFVLCYLQGKSTTAAAAQLGLKLGTFSARLSRAKKAVLDALAKRGCSAIAVAASLAGVTASAPPGLANRVVQLTLLNGTIPVNLLALTQGVTQMGVSKFKFLAAALVLGSLLAGSFGVWSAKAQGPAAGLPGGSSAAGGKGGPPAGSESIPATPSTAAPVTLPVAARGTQRSAGFEYKVIDLVSKAESAERELNRLGEDGWELVTVTTHTAGGGREIETAYLKRRKIAAGGFGGLPGGMGGGGFPRAGGPPAGPGKGAGAPATPGAWEGQAGGPGVPGRGGPVNNANLVRSRVTVEEVSKSFIATDRGALYAIDAKTRVIKRGVPAQLTDLKPGTKAEIYWNKEAKVVTEVVIDDRQE